MDSITQATLGAAIGEALLGRKLGWKGAAWGAFFGTLPDLDLLFYPFLDEVERIYWHRGISHSVLLMVVGALICGPLLWLWWKKHSRDISLARALGFVFLVWSTHVAIDCFTTFGTSVYEPFSNERVWWNIMAIIDPLYTLPMLIGLFVSLRNWRHRKNRWLPTVLGLGLSVVYVAFSISMKVSHVSPQFDQAFKTAGADVVAISPTIFNTVLWRGLGETQDDFLIGYYSPNDTDDEIQFERVAKNQNLVEPFLGSREFEAIDWFSRGVWSAETGENGRVRVIDRRFNEMKARKDGVHESIPLFVWEFWKEGDTVRFQKAESEVRNLSVPQLLGDLWRRILGEETH